MNDVTDVADNGGEQLLVACLCAAWCGSCRGYRAIFDAMAQHLPAPRYRWVDIEAEADALGSVDVDDFPTLLIGRGDRVLFFGPITPQPAALERLIRAAGAAALPAPADDAALQRLLGWLMRSD